MKMKAAVLHGLNLPLSVEEVLLDEPKANEVLIKLSHCGVCHSDKSVITGVQKRPFPIIIGHEGSGIVEAVGPGVKSLKPGDHVITSWVAPCGHCYYCVHGKAELCLTAEKNRAKGVLADGTTRLKTMNNETCYHYCEVSAFAEYAVVPESAAISINKKMPLDLACLIGCSVMTGIGAVINTAKVVPGSTALIIGAGGVGLNVAQGCRLSGAKQIIAVDLDESKLEFSKKFGVTDVISSGNTDVVKTVMELTDGIGADYAFECIGNPITVSQCFNGLKKGGKLVMVGLAAPEVNISIPLYSIVAQEKTITGCYYGSTDSKVDFPKIVDLYLANKIQLKELVNEKFELDQINDAFKVLESNKPGRNLIVF